jgi:hypothetical protein
MAIVFLQVLILLTGNYTYFNLLTIALCIPLLDDTALRRIPRTLDCSPVRSFCRHATSAVAVLLVLLSSSAFVAQFFPDVRPMRSLELMLSPLNLTNTYGLFAVMTTSRPEIVLEGSADGKVWTPYEFKWKPGDLNRRPGLVAPMQPRLDWQMWFAALGSIQQNSWFLNLVGRLLEGSPEVAGLLAINPFPDTPPRQVRAVLYHYKFTQFGEDSGAWWKREYIGLYCRALYLTANGELRISEGLEP